MAKCNDPLAACFTLSNLLESADLAAKGVKWKGQVQRFMLRRPTECARLRRRLLDGTWEPKKGRRFQVLERGKVRTIDPPDMRTRVVERCLAEHVLMPFVERAVIADCCACLRGRGQSQQIESTRRHLEAAPPGAWFFMYDFHAYFDSIDRGAVIERLAPSIDADLLEVISKCIGGPGTGIMLGSHVSQLLATWFTTPLDLMVLASPGLVGYERYMDDGHAVFTDKASALGAMRMFRESAHGMGLTMNPKKTYCNRATHPQVFCKLRYTKRAGGVRVSLRKQSVRRSVAHANRVLEKARRLALDPDGPQIDPVPLRGSMEGSLKRGDADLTHILRERVKWPDLPTS